MNGNVQVSFDGEIWKRATTQKGSRYNWTSVTYNKNGKLMTVGHECVNCIGYITTSADGESWKIPEGLKGELGNVVTAILNGICVIP